MLSPKAYAFVDESGDASLQVDKDGVSTHFVVSAVLVRGDSLERARQESERVRRANFGPGEMKSSNVGRNDERRIALLRDLRSVPATYYVFVVDKREIWQDSGLIFKRPFLKFLTGKVYHRLFRTFGNLDVVADEHGTRAFMDEFQTYIRTNHQPTLFEDSSFRFSPSDAEQLIQVADIVSGSIRRVFDAKKPSPLAREILEALREKLVVLEEWPPLYHPLSEIVSQVVSHDHDSLVREYCKNQVSIYLRDLKEDEEHSEIREAALSYLADQSRYSEADRYVSSGEILSHLSHMGFGDVSAYVLRSQIIAHFRDNGVIVASNTAGYKVPTAVVDITNYVTRCDAVIGPMLSRLKQAREQMKLTSHGELDILSPSQFENLRSIVERT